MKPIVGIIMGSTSDLPKMREVANVLEELNIEYEIKVASAHRTPEVVAEYAKTAKSRGVKVIVAGAGGAAHLPGVIAAFTTLPIIGVPIKSSNSIDGWDSLLSIVQMPSGVPVATVAVDGTRNAGILAAQIISIANKEIEENLIEFKKSLAEKALKASKDVI